MTALAELSACVRAQAPAEGPALGPDERTTPAGGRSGVPEGSGSPVPSGAAPSVPEPPPSVPARSGPAPRALPRVSVRNIGLHIGGGPNDEETKRPFQSAIEARFEDFLRCYRFVEQPEKGGTFGVDLLIAREGGKPSVRQPRTGMAGEAFRRCVVRAFEAVEFGRPKLGPTVISYSLRFDMD